MSNAASQAVLWPYCSHQRRQIPSGHTVAILQSPTPPVTTYPESTNLPTRQKVARFRQRQSRRTLRRQIFGDATSLQIQSGDTAVTSAQPVTTLPCVNGFAHEATSRQIHSEGRYYSHQRPARPTLRQRICRRPLRVVQNGICKPHCVATTGTDP